ncbi:hypothetical protein, partial [Mycoplasma bradburyae]|uniref:hypothetical protein n=1 Tax=Mycoplasma bradburyae TaxID=2963128 RepID=UPI0023400A05
EMTVKDYNGQDVKKNLLDLGSAEFKTLVDLNKQGVVRTTTGGTGEASAQPVARASIVEMIGTPEAQPQPEVSQDQTSGLNNEFKTLIHGESSEYKTKLDKIKEAYPDFNPDNLYLSGQAKLVNLWKANDNWHGNYYLTSKEGNDNKLSIKYKGKDWSIDLTEGLFIQDLLPDYVKVYVSKIDNQTVTIEEQNNLETYKNQINAEKAYTDAEKNRNNKYSFDETKGILTVNPDKINDNDTTQMPVVVNLIKIPYTNPNNTEKILFKVKYSFDGIGFYNGDIFGTKLLFKKIHKWDFNNVDNAAIKSQKVASIWLGTNYIPRNTTDKIDIQAVKNKNRDFNTWPNWDEYFWKGAENDKGFVNAIQGTENSINGNGVSQLIMKSGDKTYAPDGQNSQTDSKYNLNQNSATNFIVFSRVSYIKNNQNDDQKWGYLWSNSITLLHVD